LRLPNTQGCAPRSARWAFALTATPLLALFSVIAASANPQIASLYSETAESSSTSRTGVIPTREGLQLTVKADCARVQIFTDAPNEVSYSVRLDARIAPADARALLQDFSLTAHRTPRGVVLFGSALHERDCRSAVIYEIHVPRRYSLDVAVQSGSIAAQDIDGVVAFSTGGGDLRVGSVGSLDSAAKSLANAAFTAQLETAGGDISLGDIAGGLRATTGGGQISAGDVHGPAALRTGGGDIRVGHVFGAARFLSGGGNITARKIDGGLWAETDGGRVQIGNGGPLAALEPGLSANDSAALLPALLHSSSEDQQGVPALSAVPDIAEFARLFDVFFWGGIRVDPMEQQKHLVASVAPSYPEVARLASIEGDVTLRILVDEDGTVRDIRPISGPPVLGRAALRAVEQWRYAPALVDGHPVDVVTTVTFSFRLH
jgi:TonB family protein